MSQPPEDKTAPSVVPPSPPDPRAERAARLASALRANLRRRKAGASAERTSSRAGD